MTTAVTGATGRVGSEIVRGLLARGDTVAALVRDPDRARRAFGEPDGLHIRLTRLDDPRDLTEAFDGIRTVFIAMGSIGIEGVLQRIAINVAAGSSSIEQVTRLSVLNISAESAPKRRQSRLRPVARRPLVIVEIRHASSVRDQVNARCLALPVWTRRGAPLDSAAFRRLGLRAARRRATGGM
jgi:NAD(P)-dependent dehydrogenase (short-subunit alcohol dehydrogenase family)